MKTIYSEHVIYFPCKACVFVTAFTLSLPFTLTTVDPILRGPLDPAPRTQAVSLRIQWDFTPTTGIPYKTKSRCNLGPREE